MKKGGNKNQWIAEYEKECNRQSEEYEQWILAWETAENRCSRETASLFFVTPWKHLFRSWDKAAQELELMLGGLKKDVRYVIFTGAEGDLAGSAFHKMKEYFEMHPDEQILYGDEDEWSLPEQKRRNPWFKPDWSPDTLRSCLYVGNIVVMKAALLKDVIRDMSDETVRQKCRKKYRNYCQNDSVFWGFLLYLADTTVRHFGHIDSILFHRRIKEGISDQQPENEIQEIVHVRAPFSSDAPMISVVIPSKDHPQLLMRCLHAVFQVTEYPSYEIIVVDNGSSPENRESILAMQDELPFIYLYREMDFNFSGMCNLGASNAKGEILLFLNDDIEVCGKDWMTILAEQAALPHVGAVGAKLYYPDSRIIQHAGITNMRIGPAHKLGGRKDQGNLYHGRNLADYNMLAVTAACMAVAHDKYDLVGGFDEELAVAYNDVDFCFSLYEKGFYNLLRNDVALFHHESLSRGSDGDGKKNARLLRERKRLYEKHRELYGKDPFYSRHLVQERLDADYHVEYQYEYERIDRYSKVDLIPEKKPTGIGLFRRLCRKGPWVLHHLDDVRIRQKDPFHEEPEVLEIEGWCSLTDRDMPEYERTLLLVGPDGRSYQLEMLNKLRRDAQAVLTGQRHGALCGFVVRIRYGELAPGCYRIGYLFTPKSGGREIVWYEEEQINLFAPNNKK